MTPLLALVLLVLIAFIGSFLFKRIKIKALWVKAVAYSGVLYIFLGYIIGPNITGLVSGSVAKELNVLFALVLGWAGFLIGVQTNIKGLKRFPSNYYLSGTISFVLTLVFLYIFIWPIVHLLNISYVQPADVFLLCVMGAITSPVVLGVLRKDYRLDGRLSYRLQFAAAFNNLLGVMALEAVFFINALLTERSVLLAMEWLRFMFPVLMVPLSVFLYSLIYKVVKTRQEKFLLFLSLLFLLVGLAFYFKQSILFISFLFGVGLANIQIPSVKLYRSIQELEKPLYIILLIFAGINLRLYENLSTYALLAGFILVRIAVKVLSEGFVIELIDRKEDLPWSLGLGGLGMGGFTLAGVLDYLLLGHVLAGHLFLFIMVVSLVLNDIIALRYLSRNLIKNSI